MKHTGRPYGETDKARNDWRRRQDDIARAERDGVAAERRTTRNAPYRRDRARITPEA